MLALIVEILTHLALTHFEGKLGRRLAHDG